MTSRSNLFRGIPLVFWGLTVTALAIWIWLPGVVIGWDLNVYKEAVIAIRAGHDPYVNGMAVQRVFHATLAQHPKDPPPYTYVYSPMTLPLLHWLATVPFWKIASVYWTAYIAGVITALWFGWQAVEADEQRVFAFLLPAAVFFPGLLNNDVLFSGNVAIIIYGAVFAATMVGWRRRQWGWFYAVVLLSSICKAPMLTLLAVPVLSARRQWLPAIATGMAGLALFAVQPAIWPVAFRNYLEAVELQFSYNHDFSSSPAGLLADALYYKLPYQVTSIVFYPFYAAVIGTVLLYLRRQFLAGRFSEKQWLPVMMVGVVLLNPRVMEYDVAPLTILMALLAWRFFAGLTNQKGTILWSAVLFVVLNALAPAGWRTTECCALVGLFFAGAWTLYRQAATLEVESRAAVEPLDFEGLREEVMAR
jgi:hypothetical protein